MASSPAAFRAYSACDQDKVWPGFEIMQQRIRLYLGQGPGNAALGRIEHKDASNVGLADQLVGRAGEHSLQPVQVIAGREAVECNQRLPDNASAHRVACCECIATQSSTPVSAALTHSCIEASMGI